MNLDVVKSRLEVGHPLGKGKVVDILSLQDLGLIHPGGYIPHGRSKQHNIWLHPSCMPECIHALYRNQTWLLPLIGYIWPDCWCAYELRLLHMGALHLLDLYSCPLQAIYFT